MKYLFFCTSIFLFWSTILVAGDSTREVTAVRITTPPKIDGVLDDAVWNLAQPAVDFTQRDPEEGKPGSQRSEIRVLYDNDALYFACMFYDSEPDKIVSRLGRRDEEPEADNASIRLDAYHDHQTGYEFTFNAAGVKADKLQYDDANQEDDSWDPVWDVQTAITPQGWLAEIKIPFRILRYRKMDSDSAENVMGINFFRYISRRQESERWAFTPKKETGLISKFGHLRGLKNLPDLRPLELTPFVVAKQQFEPSSPFIPGEDKFLGNGGLDLKYGVSSNFVLDATVNPDFGQVEADPAVLNLSAFETFYPEKRPFFIEGTQVLHFTTFGGTFGPGMFYSRRIGRGISPREANPMGGHIESIPQTTTILGAAKLTGKTNSGLSIGLLEAATQEESATIIDSSGNRHTEILEPFANYNVLRLKQDVMENSNVGIMLTSTSKDSRYPAFTNGYDWNLNFDHNTYQLFGFLALSHTTNGNDERVWGSAGKVDFGKIAGEHWTWNFDFDWTSKKYNIDDIGFFFSPNDIGDLVSVNYQENVPGELVRSYAMGVSFHSRWNFDGYNIARNLSVNGNMLFANYWSWQWGFERDNGIYDQFETHFSGLYKAPATYHVSTGISTDSRNVVVASMGGQIDWNIIGGRSASSNIGLGLKPLSWMAWELEWNYAQTRNRESWGGNSHITGLPLFGDRATTQHNLTIRNTTTFTRELTLQIYQQVFLAKGHYDNSRTLLDPSTFGPLNAGDSPLGDFNNQALHTNVVLRWEYLPGSTFYFVWTQARNGFLGDFSTQFSNDVNNTFLTAPSNVFLVKMSYLLGI